MDTDISRSFRRNVKTLRVEKKLSQNALADLAGLPAGYIFSIENGRQLLSLNRLQRIADALNVPVARLFEMEKDSAASSCPL